MSHYDMNLLFMLYKKILVPSIKVNPRPNFTRKWETIIPKHHFEFPEETHSSKMLILSWV